MQAGPKIKKEKTQDGDKLLWFSKAAFKRNNSDLWLQAIVGWTWQVEETVFIGLLQDVWLQPEAFYASREEQILRISYVNLNCTEISTASIQSRSMEPWEYMQNYMIMSSCGERA